MQRCKVALQFCNVKITLQIDGIRKAFNEYATHNVTTGDGQSLSRSISDMSTGEAKLYITKNIILPNILTRQIKVRKTHW